MNTLVARAPVAPKQGIAQSALFEGMFVRAVQPKGQFADDLKAVGFDVQNIKPEYPMTVWKASLEVACRHLYAGTPLKDALRTLAHEFLEGYTKTPVGKVITIPLPLLGIARVMAGFPKIWKTIRPDVNVESVQEDSQRWRLVFQDSVPSPDFVAGLIEGGGKLMGTTVTVDVVKRMPTGFEMVASW